MGLPKRPTIVVRAPTAVFVGERAVIEVQVEAEKETKVDFVDVRILGEQHWVRGGSDGSYGVNATYPSMYQRVMHAGVLPPGTHPFPVSFTLPPGTAPSHQVRPASARLTVEVYVSIPWWPDVRDRFTLQVRLPVPPDAQRRPVMARVPYAATGDQPRIEVALASATLVAGETMLGSCAVYHVDDSKPRELDVSFEPFISFKGAGRAWAMYGDGYRTTITLPAGSAGTSVPIRVALPAEMTPTFASMTHDVAWFVKLKTGSLFTTKLEATIPITILDMRAAATLPQLMLVPRLADQRALTVFERYAQQSSLPNVRLLPEEREAFPGEVPSVVRTLDDSEIRVGYAYRGKDGTFLVARVTYASLGLGLSIRPSSALRALLSSDIEVGVADWDRVHRVDAREAAQAVPFLRSLVPTPPLGDLVRWTDHEIVFERAVTSVDAEDLAQLMLALDRLAGAITFARASIRPPAGIELDADAWRALAERLGGTLCAGDLSITGKLDTTPVELGLVFDDDNRPAELRAYVGDTRLATERAREASLLLAHPATATESEATDSKVRSLLDTWSPDIVKLELAHGVAAASLPVAAGGTDAQRVRELIRNLQALLGSLDESTGPYR